MKNECQPHLDVHNVPVNLPTGFAADLLKVHPDDTEYVDLCPLCVQLMTVWLQHKAAEAQARVTATTIVGTKIWTPDQER